MSFPPISKSTHLSRFCHKNSSTGPQLSGVSGLVLALVESFSWKSFKKNYFLREFASGWFLQRQRVNSAFRAL